MRHRDANVSSYATRQPDPHVAGLGTAFRLKEQTRTFQYLHPDVRPTGLASGFEQQAAYQG